MLEERSLLYRDTNQVASQSYANVIPGAFQAALSVMDIKENG